MLVEPGRDERPRLPQHVRQRDQERRHQRHLERHEERAGHVGRDHRRAGRQRAQQRLRRAARRCPWRTGTGTRSTTTTAMIERMQPHAQLDQVRDERFLRVGRFAHRQGEAVAGRCVAPPASCCRTLVTLRSCRSRAAAPGAPRARRRGSPRRHSQRRRASWRSTGVRRRAVVELALDSCTPVFTSLRRRGHRLLEIRAPRPASRAAACAARRAPSRG